MLNTTHQRSMSSTGSGDLIAVTIDFNLNPQAAANCLGVLSQRIDLSLLDIAVSTLHTHNSRMLEF